MARAGPSNVTYPTSGGGSHSRYPGNKQSGGFNGQDDFISFDNLFAADEVAPADRNERGPGSYARNERGEGTSAMGRGGALGRRGTKRPIGEVLDEKGKRKLKDVEKTTPWTSEVDWDSCPTAKDQLSAEIKAFVSYIQPTDQEHDLRLCIIESIRRVILRRFKDAQVLPFGSFETKLYLPTGDIDLVVVSPSIPTANPQKKKFLYAISTLLQAHGVGRDVVVIARAKVPIVKFVSVHGGFNIDISLNQTNGLGVSTRVNTLFKQVGDEPARALVLLVKSFLKQRNMNEVYSGGLGSYSIICLVVSFLQLHPKLQQKEIKAWENLGPLAIEFLELYGKHFNYDDVGICLSGTGSYYSKAHRGWQRPGQPYLLSVEDPADPTNDVAGGSHNILGVRSSLGGAYEVLTSAMYQRQSIIDARRSFTPIGVTQPVLSGRLIPYAEDENANVDECRKSLLGAIMGMTTETEQKRVEVKRLSQMGVVHRMIGEQVVRFDEDGARIGGAGKKGKQVFAHDQPKPVPANGEQHGLPPRPTTADAAASTLPARSLTDYRPATSGDQQKAIFDRIASSSTFMAEQNRPSVAEKERKPAAPTSYPVVEVPRRRESMSEKATSGSRVIDLASPSPPRQQKRQRTSASHAKGFIDLDSPSPPAPAAASLPAVTNGIAQTASNGDAQESDEESRYSVKKGSKPSRPDEVQYVLHESDHQSESSDLEAGELQVPSNRKGKAKGAGPTELSASESEDDSESDESDDDDEVELVHSRRNGANGQESDKPQSGRTGDGTSARGANGRITRSRTRSDAAQQQGMQIKGSSAMNGKSGKGKQLAIDSDEDDVAPSGSRPRKAKVDPEQAKARNRSKREFWNSKGSKEAVTVLSSDEDTRYGDGSKQTSDDDTEPPVYVVSSLTAPNRPAKPQPQKSKGRKGKTAN